MKKQFKNEPAVKLGGGSFNIEFVRSFSSKQAFVCDEKLRSLVQFTGDIDDYLSCIWEKCHENEQFTPAETQQEISENVIKETTDTTEIKNVATKRKSESKKE